MISVRIFSAENVTQFVCQTTDSWYALSLKSFQKSHCQTNIIAADLKRFPDHSIKTEDVDFLSGSSAGRGSVVFTTTRSGRLRRQGRCADQSNAVAEGNLRKYGLLSLSVIAVMTPYCVACSMPGRLAEYRLAIGVGGVKWATTFLTLDQSGGAASLR